MRRLARLLRRRKLDGELAAEISAHIEERVEELVESGMSAEEARYAARVQFGNGTAILEQSREVWSFGALETFLRDVRVGARALRHAPLFTLAAVATLMLGIGANTAIFSLIDAVLLRPLPFPEPSRIAVLWERPPKTVVTASLGTRKQQNPLSPATFLAWRSRTHSFEAMAALSPPEPIGIAASGPTIAVDGLSVSAGFFPILGARPLLGRTLGAADDVPGAPPVAVLSYGLWRRLFGADRSVVGRVVRMMGYPCAIVGVMPEGFDLSFAHTDLWTPMRLGPGAAEDSARYLSAIAKLRPGVSRAQAQADLDAVAREIAQERPASNRGWGAGLVPLSEQTTGDVSTALWLLFGAVMFVLLIAAGNVAGLLMMRGAGRRREIALRIALGAGRARMVSQLLTEGFLLALAGGLAGVGLAVAGLRAITASLPALALPRVEGVAINARVLAFSLALSVLTTLLFGLAPALASARTEPETALRAGNRGTTRHAPLRRIMVIAEWRSRWCCWRARHFWPAVS